MDELVKWREIGLPGWLTLLWAVVQVRKYVGRILKSLCSKSWVERKILGGKIRERSKKHVRRRP